MANMTDLWPAEIDVTSLIPPATILREQATMLGKRTKNIVLGEVKAREVENQDFSYDFYIVAPALGNYRYKLFTISYSVDLYPVIIEIEKNIVYGMLENRRGGLINPMKVDSEDMFLEILKEIFGSSKTKRVISTLLAQSTADYKASKQEQ